MLTFDERVSSNEIVKGRIAKNEEKFGAMTQWIHSVTHDELRIMMVPRCERAVLGTTFKFLFGRNCCDE